MLGCYVHIPFCEKKCHYCDYVITTDRSQKLRARFLETLACEIQHAREKFGTLEFDTLYIGGGTPSALTRDEMERIFKELRSAFRIKADAEISCELNPGDIQIKDMHFFRELGINRVSVGAQSFEDVLLQKMGRPHSAQDIRTTLRALNETGFRNISCDLIMRLPGQTVSDIENSICAAQAEGVHQMVLYDLNVHAKTVFGALARKRELPLPDEATHFEMQTKAETLLTQRFGFKQYEISSFAKPGFESQHNLVYWHNQPYLGLGPGAFGYMQGRRTQLARNVSRYLEKIAKSDWSCDEEDEMTPLEREIESVLVGLRLAQGINPTDYKLIENHLKIELPRLEAKGMLNLSEQRAKLTAKGRHLAETVFTQLACVSNADSSNG